MWRCLIVYVHTLTIIKANDVHFHRMQEGVQLQQPYDIEECCSKLGIHAFGVARGEEGS